MSRKEIPEAKDALFFKDKKEFRAWLKKHFEQEKSEWLLFYKKHTGKKSITYPEALDEALCFGWIDGTLKRIDEEKHIIRFTRRRKKSPWSLKNKTAALRLIKEKKMTKAGLDKISEAKENRLWQKAYTSRKAPVLPKDLKEAFSKNKTAEKNFFNFANCYKTQYVGWVNDAKRDETRKNRIKSVVERAEKNKKPGE